MNVVVAWQLGKEEEQEKLKAKVSKHIFFIVFPTKMLKLGVLVCSRMTRRRKRRTRYGKSKRSGTPGMPREKRRTEGRRTKRTRKTRKTTAKQVRKTAER